MLAPSWNVMRTPTGNRVGGGLQEAGILAQAQPPPVWSVFRGSALAFAASKLSSPVGFL